MRPIDKGTIPIEASGSPVGFSFFQQSRGHLISRIGPYCCYCERFLGGNIAVEHIQPKSKVPGLELDWDNFLLACNNCNSIKGDKPINLNDYFWPDQDNTFRVFEYSPGAIISVSSFLNHQDSQIAENTIKLTGLDRVPSDDLLVNPEAKDRRWRERLTAWDKANHATRRLTSCNTNEMREQIVDTATSTGFFSIWMTVFSHDTDMMQRFVTSFQGTSLDCFDKNLLPIRRSGGAV